MFLLERYMLYLMNITFINSGNEADNLIVS